MKVYIEDEHVTIDMRTMEHATLPNPEKHAGRDALSLTVIGSISPKVAESINVAHLVPVLQSIMSLPSKSHAENEADLLEEADVLAVCAKDLKLDFRRFINLCATAGRNVFEEDLFVTYHQVNDAAPLMNNDKVIYEALCALAEQAARSGMTQDRFSELASHALMSMPPLTP